MLKIEEVLVSQSCCSEAVATQTEQIIIDRQALGNADGDCSDGFNGDCSDGFNDDCQSTVTWPEYQLLIGIM